MSDSTPPEPVSSEKPPISGGRKWRRRGIILLCIVIAGSIIGRILVPVLLPPVLRKVARGYGLTATYDKLDLYALSGDVALWGLKFTPTEGGDPVIDVAYCRGAISPLGLLRGKLKVQRVEAEDALLLLQRKSDGSMPLLQKLLASSSNPSTAAPTSTSSSLSLDPPLKIDVLRLQNARARLSDLSQAKPVNVDMNLDLLVTDVGSPDKDTRVEMQLHSPQTLAALYVSAQGSSRNNQLDAQLAVKMYGLNLLPTRCYLSDFGIVPTSENLSAQAEGHLQVTLTPPPANSQNGAASPTLSAKLSLADMLLSADSKAAGSIKQILMDAPSISPGRIDVDQVSLSGIQLHASRDAHGVQFAGIALGPTTTPSVKAPTTRSSPVASNASVLPILSLKKLAITDVSMAFDDEIVSPPVHLALNSSSISIENLTSDLTRKQTPARFQLLASAPGICSQVEVKGEVLPASETKSAKMTVSAAGISPTVLQSYLKALGISNELAAGRFSCAITAAVVQKPSGHAGASFTLTDAQFADGDKPLFAMPLVDLQNTDLALDGSSIHLGKVTLKGPVLPIVHSADGSISALGLGISAPPPLAQTASAPTTLPTTRQAISLPSLAIDQFDWSGVDLNFRDLSGAQPIDVPLKDLTVSLRDIVLSANPQTVKTGTFHVQMSSPAIVQQFSIDGHVTPTSNSVTLDMSGKGTGITAAKLKPLLASLGIEPVMADGALQFDADATVRQSQQRTSADLAVHHASLSDGDTRWLSLGEFKLEGASFDGQRAEVESISFDQPTARITRDSNGAFSVAGIRLLPTRSNNSPSGASTQPANSQIDLTLPVTAMLNTARLTHASIQFIDNATKPPTQLIANADASLNQLVVGQDAPAATFDAKLNCPGLFDSVASSGSFRLAPKHQSMAVSIAGRGLDGSILEPYLPPNVALDLKGGSFTASLAGDLSVNPDGGSSGAIKVSNVRLAAGSSSTLLAGLDEFNIEVDRFDLAGDRIAVRDIALKNAELAAKQDETGVSLFGLLIAPKPLRAAQPVREPTSEPSATTTASDVNALVTTAHQKLPLITVGKIDLGVKKLSLQSSQLADELALTGVSLVNTSPIELLGNDPTQRPQSDFQFSAKVDKLIDSVGLTTQLSPFAAEPHAKVDLDVRGIHADALTRFLPKLTDLIDGADLSNGRFTSSANARFAYTRRGPFGIDLTRDVTADFSIKDTRLTQSGVDEPLAGLDEIRAEHIRFSPGTGALVVKNVELTKPIAHVLRDASGIHALGLTVKMPAATQPTMNPDAPQISKSSEPAPSSPTVHPANSTLSDTAPEMRIDRLAISGVDFSVEDHVGTIPTTLPVTSLDVEVKGLSNKALTQPLPIRFTAMAGAGKVLLPTHSPSATQATELRPVFAEATASGNLILSPHPSGYVKTSLSGLELAAIRGLANQFGINLTSGSFDLRLDARMKGTDSFEAKVFPTFNELRVTEPANGPIARLLQLPAPLDIVVSTLEDSDGALSLPLTIPMEAGHLDYGAIIGSAVGSIGKTIAEAMLAAPLKAAKVAALIGGVDLSGGRTKPIEPILLSFAPGESQLTATQDNELNALIHRMRKDDTLAITLQQTLGPDDVTLVETRVNPQSEDSLALASQLRQKKFSLQQQQVALALQLRAALATGQQSSIDSATDDIQAVSTELKETEDGLDQLLDLQRPGAARLSTRRTKAASILLADMRLRAVQQKLLESGLPQITNRISKSNATFNPADSGNGKLTLVLSRQAKS